MTGVEAHEIRAALTNCLEPLYAARLGNVARHLAIEMAIGRLQKLDALLLTVEQVEAAREAVT